MNGFVVQGHIAFTANKCLEKIIGLVGYIYPDRYQNVTWKRYFKAVKNTKNTFWFLWVF